MLYLIRLFIAFLTAYFFGRIIYLYFCNPKEKNNIISILHSFLLGLGFTSISFWFYTIATNGYNSNYHIIETCSVILIYLYLRLKKRKRLFSKLPIKNIVNGASTEKKRLLINYLTVILFGLIAVYSFFKCLKYPDGTWDALAMWNFRAKFLSCGNDAWNRMYFETFDYSHRDYPLFLSSTIARFYNYVGRIDTIIPLFFAWFFNFNCFVLPYLYLNKLKNKYYSIFAVVILSFSPTIFFHGCVQYADMPLAVFFLVSLYEFIILGEKDQNLPWLGMLFAGLCFWIKNEGIPLFISYSIFILYYLYKRENNYISAIKKFLRIIPILLPIIISVLFVRYFAKGENDLIFKLSDRLKQIFELERYIIIIPYIWTFIKQHFWIIFIPIYLLAGFIDKKYKEYIYFLFIILMMNIVYIIVYLITPHDLIWHIENSYPRIASVFLPSLIFLSCLLFKNKRE